MPEAFCGLEMCAKRLSELCALCERKNLPSVRGKTPQRVTCVSSHRVGAFYFSQIYTDEQNTQSLTETLSQPISQNVTATFSYNVLWYLYAGGVLWVRNCAQKCSVKSVSSVRERNVLRERITSPRVLHTYALWEKETLWIGEWTFLWWYESYLTCAKNLYKIQQGRPLFTIEILARCETITNMISESYDYETRKGLSCFMEGLSKHQEGRVLERWRASFTTLNGLPYI